ncbi:MAG: hypothetical protein EBS19_12105 [Spirochaetia bacterium]|nr:hypothetical protein [Spirochaetia bacterium]
MSERQSHGLVYEKSVKDKLGLLDYENNQSYTSKYDAKTKDGKPVSIKTEKYKTSVELGDYFRNANIDEDFYMIVSFWEKEKTNIVEEYHLLIPAEVWKSFFKREFDERIKELIFSASNERSYDSIWKEKIKQLSEDYGKPIIRLRPKRDHKRQKRMQCAIMYNDFIKLHELYKTEDLEN